MDIIWETIIETIMVVLFKFPGAFIRWCFTGFRKSYKDVLFDDSEANGPVGFLVTVVIILGIILLTGCDNVQNYNKGNDTAIVEIKKDSTAPVIADDTLDRTMMFKVDSAVSVARESGDTFLTAYFPPNEFTDTLKTILFVKQGKPLRIQYTTFEDSGAAFGSEDLYFNDSLGIIRESRSENSVFYECVKPDGRLFRFRKYTETGVFDGRKEPTGAADNFIGGMLRMAHSLIQLYPDFKFNIPNISLKGDSRLLVMSPIPLYESPDTTTDKIKLLKYRARIGYIRSNDIIGNFGNKKWIWYFVKSDTDSGWVVGHPDFVQDLTDENAEEWPE